MRERVRPHKRVLFFLALSCATALGELQTTIQVTAPDISPGVTDTFSANALTGPAAAISGTYINPYANVLQYVLGSGSGRFASVAGTRQGIQFDSFQIFQSILTPNFFTMVTSSTNCPATGTYTWLNIRWRSPDAPRRPVDVSVAGVGAGGVLSYASDTFSSTSRFDLAGPTTFATAYGYDSSTYGNCASGVLRVAETGASVIDPLGRFFFGTTFAFFYGSGGNPNVAFLVPQQTLTAPIMSALAQHRLSGLFTTFDAATSQTRSPVYIYPDSAGTTFTIRTVDNIADPTAYTNYATATCTTLNSPYNGFCRGTISMEGTPAITGNIVCQIGATSVQDVLACTFQKPGSTTIGGSIIATRSKEAVLSVSVPTLAPNIAPAGSTTIAATLTNLTGSRISTLANPAVPADQLQSPMSNPSAYTGAGGTCGSSLAGYSSCTMNVTYAPSVVGTTLQTLRVAYNNQSSTVNATNQIIGASGLTSLAISPNSSAFEVGANQQFTSTATYSNGTTQDVTLASGWSSTQASVATITSGGLANFASAGTTTIGATLAGVSTSFSPTAYVSPPNPSGLNANGNGYTQVDLSWVSGGGSTAAFQIAYQSGATAPASCTAGTVISSGIVGSGTSYSVTGLIPGAQYSFRVCAEAATAGSLSTGITATSTTTIPHTAFATAATYRGSIGSLHFADYICQSEAESAGLTGIWKAIASDEAVSAASRISLSESIYNTRPAGSGGIQVVSTAGAFWGAHTNTIGFNAAGTAVGSANVWTGSNTSGVIYAGRTCTSWSTSSTGVNGQYGQSNVATAAWLVSNQANCNNLYSLYCINLQSSSAAPPNPTGFANYTLGPTSASFTWESGGGTTAAYKLVYQTGGTAPANCNSGTVVSASTLGLNPSSYNITGLSSSTQYSFRLCSTNSDQSSISSGVTATVTTLANGSSVITDLTNRQIVFATSSVYNGNLGSIYFADYLCQGEATNAGLTGGIWKAILSDASTSATSRIAIPGKVYNNRPFASGGLQEISANSAAFWASSAVYAVNYNAGGTSPGSTISWTGSAANGTISAGNHCTNWTTSSSGVNGAYGTNTNTGNIINTGNTACNTTRSLYCTNQQTSSAAPPNPSNFATYTVGPTAISFTWDSGGGTTAAYKLAYQAGASAPADCNSGTTVGPSTIGFNATSYTVTGLPNTTQYSFRLCALNSDESSMSSGSTVTATTLANGSSTQVDLTNRQVVFSTSSTRNASFGGIYFGDFVCQNEASAAGLTGIWKAILGDETTSALSRIAIAGKVYNMRPLGSGGIQEVVPDSAAFWSSAAAYAFNYNASGGSPGTTVNWTGATAAGAVQTGLTCTNWTSGSAVANGRSGTNTATGNNISTGNSACSGLLSLYCTNQQAAAAAPTDPSDFSTYTLGPTSISFVWTSGGGTTAGFKLAYQTGATPPANCNSGTVIGATTLGVNPSSYTVSSLASSTQYSFRLCAVNSDQSAASAGLTVTTSTLSSGSAVQIDLSTRQVVFSTSNLYNGAFGSVYTGDYICQTEAVAAGLTGVWKAILSDEGTSAISRLAIAGKVYNNRPLASGGIQEIAANSTAFWASSAGYPVNYNANGSSPGSTIVWTGSLASGSINTGNTCQSWTSSSSGNNGTYGTNTNTGNIINTNNTACNTTRVLYCTNQQSASAAPPDPVDFSTYTLAPTSLSFIWTSGGGTTAAFKLAYQTGGTAPANCNSGTVVSAATLGINPSSYTLTGLTASTQYSFRLCAVNSDESAASTGTTVTATTLAAGQPTQVDLSTRQVVFTTTATYRGLMGGLPYADFICQNEAQDNGLSGIWKAVLSDESTSAFSRISIPGKVYNMRPLLSGGIQQIAPNSAGFWGGSAAFQLYYNAGGTTPGGTQPWTGSTTAGAINTGLTCTNWTTNVTGTNGRIGTANTTGNVINTNNSNCNTARPLYCINQQSSAAAPSNPSGFAIYSTAPTSIGLKWTSGGGTTAGFRIAYQTGGTAPADCTSGTVISAETVGLNASTYAVNSLTASTQYSFRLCAANSDRSSFSSGVTVTGTTLGAGLSATVDYSATQVVFATSNRYNGNLGGIHFADWVCNREAATSSLTGVWKAVLSDEATSASSRLSLTGPIYNNRPLASGGIQAIATNSAAFWTATYEFPLSYTQSGATPTSANTWTGSTSTGGIQTGLNCTSWTSASAAVNGRHGLNTSVAATSVINQANLNCSNTNHLYCVNLQSAAAAPPNPVSFVTGTIGTTSIQLNWASGGGTTAAYRIAYQSGGTAPANCSTGTVIPSTTLGVNPTTYTVTGLTDGTQYSFRVCALNSDESQVSSGSTLSATSTALVTPTNQTLFATAGNYYGAIGGLYFADYICQTEATNAALAGVWKAVLSDESTSALSRIALNATIYNNRPVGSGGAQQVATSGTFWSGTYTVAPNYNASGGAPGGTATWSGSNTAGGINTGLTCSSWTSHSGNGRYGNNNATTSANLYNNNNTTCNTARPLYCIDRQTSSAAPSDPSGFSVVYKTSTAVGLVWASGGGTTAAYKLAYQTGASAPADCNSGTTIAPSTLGVNPTSYSVTGLSASTQYSFRLCAANSDITQLSSGVTVTTTTQAGGDPTNYSLATNQFLFVTTNTYRGSFGGLYYGDFVCQTEAEAAGLSGIWKAVLSDGTTSASSRISLSGNIHNLRDPLSGGSQRIIDATNFWTHLHTNAINYTALGALSTTGLAWTGTTTTGAADANTCVDWTSQLGANNGRYGTATSFTSPYSTGNRGCNNLTSLYCVNQQSASAAPPNPTGFANYATSTTTAGFVWNSGGGTTAAFQLAYQTGGTAPANCTTGTIVSASTLGVNPSTYSVSGLTASTQYSFRLCATNSDRSAYSAGVTATLTTPASGSTITLGTTQVVFATERTYTGRIGGLHFADYACQLEAEEVGLTGVWKAVLSTSATNAASRITLSSDIFNTRSTNEGGIQRLSDSVNFWAGPWLNVANYSVDGDAPGSTRGWTGTTTTGVVNGTNHCADWTSATSTTNGTHGNLAVATNPVTANNVACSNVSSLFCTNQQSASAAPSDPTGFAALATGSTFITLKWASGGGTTAAYKLAYQTGGSAPANCNSGTIVSPATLGVNPTGYTVTALTASTQYSFRLCALNSDLSLVSAGVTTTVTTSAAGTSYNVGTSQLLFATNSGYTGNFGGVYFGDFACQTEAEAAGLSGVWKAVLSDGSSNASSRVAFSGTLYNLRAGGSGGIQEVTDGSLFYSNSAFRNIAYFTASGGTPFTTAVWTGSTIAGVAGNHCSNWTTAASTTTGAAATNNTTTAYLFSANNNCNNTRSLWCTNQQSASAAPPNPSSFTYTSVTNDAIVLNWVSGGGTTAGYKLAYQTGGTAPANCASGTVVAATTLGVNPSTYTLTGLTLGTQYSFRLCAVNSDQSSVSAGTTLTATTTSGGTTFNLGTTQFIFATSGTYYGNFGGLGFGDYICQSEAESAGLTGIWKAILSDESTAASARLSFSANLYNMRPAGSGGPQLVSAGADYFGNGTLSATYPYTASGTAPSSTVGFSGTTAVGASNTGLTCSDWTVGSTTANGSYNRNNSTTTFANNGNSNCGTLRGLVCINQQSSSAAPPNPSSFAAISTGTNFVTFAWVSGGGSTAGYKMSYQTGGTAPADCNTGTIVNTSSLGLNPTNYTVTGLSSSTQYSFRLCAVNSDSSSLSSGSTVTTTTLSSGTSYAPGTNQFVFVTTGNYYGNFGGLYTADHICQTEALDAGLPGIWKAMLSDGTTNASARISLSGKMYNMRPGSSGGIQRISDSTSFFSPGALSATFPYSSYASAPGSTNHWTGSNVAGAVNSTNHCSNWTSSVSTINGTVGRNDILTQPLTSANTACNVARPLFCINQQAAAAAPTNPTTFQADITTSTSISLTWVSGGGTTSTYRLAYQSGGTPPADCTTGTLVQPSALAFNATNYTVTGLSPSTQYSFRLCSLNSDRSLASAGATLSATTTSGAVSFTPGANQYLFTTATTYTGNFGGLHFADFICNNEATASSLTGTWKAVLGDSTTSLASRLTLATDIYNTRAPASGGSQRLASSGFFLDGVMWNSQNFTAAGSATTATRGWTGSGAAGALNAANVCTDWTVTTGNGRSGTVNTVSNAWLTSANSACTSSFGFYCMNQQSSPATPANPATFTQGVTTTSSIAFSFSSGGGTTAGYKIAYQLGATPPTNCTTGTVVPASTIGVNPTAYTVSGLSAATQYSFRLCAVNSDQSSASAGLTITATTN